LTWKLTAEAKGEKPGGRWSVARFIAPHDKPGSQASGE
jgi:hypothetical protein